VLIGGTAEHLLHGAPCPVAVAPRGLEAGAMAPAGSAPASSIRRTATGALRGAVAVACRLGARLWMVAVDEQPPYTSSAIAPGYGSPELERIMRGERRADLERAAATVPDGAVAEAMLLDGPAGRTLAAASEDLDLLVWGHAATEPSAACCSAASRLTSSAPRPARCSS